MNAGGIRALAGEVGFEIERIDLVERRPDYLRITASTYVFGAAYERLVNATGMLSGFRVLLVAELRRPVP